MAPVSAGAAEKGRLAVAVAETAIAPIVAAVGGGEVETFTLFRGCILRKDLMVEPSARARLSGADAVVWTGYLNESAAIHASLGEAGAQGPRWIDVSRGASRVNAPVSDCYGYVDPSLMSGDPFFWLNPRNGLVIARNVANGLGDLRPGKRAYFQANADAFRGSLQKDIDRWKQELKPVASLRVFSTQCGWQNFAKLGGPVFAVCKGTPGVLPTPERLVEHVLQMRARVVILDPNTPAEYGQAFRSHAALVVLEVPSALDDLPGSHSYSALFDNLTRALLKVTANLQNRRAD
jgi:ABC-type Zn uptake system ZnuABC Zn-binding protein ZnuA